jgi:hypothetical protein
MQTFLPIATTNYKEIAKTLDNKRLFKQLLEGWQILMVLEELDPQGNKRIPKGWVNHPAVKMWRGNTLALYRYVLEMLWEVERRGISHKKMQLNLRVFAQAMLQKEVEKATEILSKTLPTVTLAAAQREATTSLALKLSNQTPIWQENQEYYEVVASTHRRALLCKNYEHYSQFGWPEDTGVAPTEYEYLWPIEIKKG